MTDRGAESTIGILASREAHASAKGRDVARIHQELVVDATPSRVYSVLTDPHLYAECTGMPARIDATVGGDFSIFDGRIVGRHVALVPGRLIVQEWRAVHWNTQAPSTVRIALEASGDGTRLTLDHESVPDEKEALVAAHWEQRCWRHLRLFAPTPPPAVAGATAVPASIREAFPFPAGPWAEPYLVPLDGGGRFLVTRRIAQLANPLVLEIGSFLGGSTRQWLGVSPAVTVVAVDSWSDGWAGDFVAKEEWWFTWPKPSPRVVEGLNATDGLYRTFLANLGDQPGRVLPVRGRSEDMLPRLAALGLEPGLIYIDADKTRLDLDLCHRLWPAAVLSGDDYEWGPEAGFPMRRHVHAFAEEHGCAVIHSGQTWVLTREETPTPPPGRHLDPPPR